MSAQNFYITTAISYVNGLPHLGHAYEAILTDVMARFQRLDGQNVMFLTGTDEHGEKVHKTAEKNGMSAQEFADLNAAGFQKMAGTLNISNDDFIRTTEPRHYEAARAIWQKLQDKGDIYLDKYEGWYSVREEGYFTEDELTKDPETGHMMTPNGTEAEWVEEPSYFFKLSEYTDKLLAFYDDHPEFIQPVARRNEIISFVKGGLRDLSVSRDKKRLSWGIPVPGDDDHVMYVWLDALTNYITAAGYPDVDCERFQSFWPADYHVIGKDIIRFHAVYWPAFLMSAGIDLPRTIFAHGFINVQGVKMSKSLGNVLSPDGLVETYGLDAIRYLLMREIPHGQDGNFSHDHAVQRINADLANGLGNLSQRTLSMIYKNCDAILPSGEGMNNEDKALLNKVYSDLQGPMREHFRAFEFHKGLEVIMSASRMADAYIDANAPWKLKKDDPERMKVVLYTLAEIIRCLAISMLPVTPEAAGKILDQLDIKSDERYLVHVGTDHALKAGVPIEKPEGVFPRIVEKEEERQKAAS
ncbi:MAG: methionine--tRNA ligase [Micavibrio sp.]|nr:methionine--tRNA ligase [Micavibrio sp.]|tara:strand:- start:2145 stop:3725 length:1581 start_codon:yes stop_codon:yes gene_type:complete